MSSRGRHGDHRLGRIAEHCRLIGPGVVEAGFRAPSKTDGRPPRDGLYFWFTGYRIITVGLDEAKVQQYIRKQQKLERRQGDLDLD